jgi:hypothetical protein
MAQEQPFEKVSCPECGMFATVRLEATGVVKNGSGRRRFGMSARAHRDGRPGLLKLQTENSSRTKAPAGRSIRSVSLG